MNITDIFIKRPILATVVSLLIVVFGLRALFELPVREFPDVQNAVIEVKTAYPGANAKLIRGFITTPLQKAVASADGVDFITSDSVDSLSTIKAFIKLNFDTQEAFTNIMSKVAEVTGDLPRESEKPVVAKSKEGGTALMYISFSSDGMNPQQITDYVQRIVQPKLETIPGVAQAELFGEQKFAMRIWLDPQRMTAHKVTASDVTLALNKNNFQTAAGKSEGYLVAENIVAKTDVSDEESFRNIVIKTEAGSLVRLRDVARIELGSERYDSMVTFNGQQAIFVGITSTPAANPLTVIDRVRAEFPHIKKDFPQALNGVIVYDATKYIRSSIKEVLRTIIEATLIVVVVIFLFLGSLRSVLIPVVTIPLSLIGVCSLMLFLGYSINLLTLLAMVLAIGMVVDDAIVVVENIHRYIESGMSKFDAALKGAREIALPVIAMTITLAAVYAPIGFMSGLTGALFKEFAFTLASSVVISGIVALTLSPMMCSKLLSAKLADNRLSRAIDNGFERLQAFYQRKLHNILDDRKVMVVFAAMVMLSLFPLYDSSSKETAPQEDMGFFFMIAQAPEYATIDYVTRYTPQFNEIFKNFDQAQDYFVINGMGTVSLSIAGMVLKPWDERTVVQRELEQPLNEKIQTIAGLRTFAMAPSPLPGDTGGMPFQFVITSLSEHKVMMPVVSKLLEVAQKSGKFIMISNSLNFSKPQTEILIDRDKAADLGISMDEIGQALSISLSGAYINRFSLEGRSYKVIPQLEREFRLNPQQLQQLHVKTMSGSLVPLSTLIRMQKSVEPNKLSQFQQLNSATLEGVLMPGVTMGEAVEFLEAEAQKILPKGMSYDYAGQTRQFKQETNALLLAFFFSLIIIFLVLSAQYESFRDPLIILISVPLSICGALIPINLGIAGLSINIYTQVGLITLIGLISKHGILMVDFANKLQRDQGLGRRAAIEQAAAVRLRPILMTTAAMIFGVLPLVFASGAGAVSRSHMGLVIATGMFIGTLFTLFVVPSFYTLIARKEQKVESVIKVKPDLVTDATA